MTEPPPSRSRDRLLAAAAEEFAKLGLRGARIQAIVRRARINERMIYHHFESKEGLYRAVMASQWSALGHAWEPALARPPSADPRADLEAVYRAFFRIVVGQGRLFVPLVLHEAMSGWKGVPPGTLAQLPQTLRARYVRGQREGVFRADCSFEFFHLAAMGLIAGLRLLGPRFEDIRALWEADADQVTAFIDQSLSLLIDGLVRRKPRGTRSATTRRIHRVQEATRRGKP